MNTWKKSNSQELPREVPTVVQAKKDCGNLIYDLEQMMVLLSLHEETIQNQNKTIEQLEVQLACFVRLVSLMLKKHGTISIEEEDIRSVFTEFDVFSQLSNWREHLADWYLGRKLESPNTSQEDEVEEFGGDYVRK